MIKKNKQTNQKKSLFFIIVLFLMLTTTLYFILIEAGMINIKNSPEPVQKDFFIADECSLIANKLIHPLDREDDCANKCHSECEVKRLVFSNSSFEKNINNCNKCYCYCK